MVDFQIAIYALLSSDTKDNYLRDYLDSNGELIEPMEFFLDPDECAESLISAEYENIFLTLGSDRSYLAEIFSKIPHICYIYLTQDHDFKHIPQVRGVYPEMEQLVDQLKKDVRIVQRTPSHLSISSSGDSNLPRALVQNVQSDDFGFIWTQVLLDIILIVQKPTENIYKDMIDEARHNYKNNKSVIKQIDEFEKTYDPAKAIWWYTRDSFIYRILNMAQSTENIVIIWKFRYIIQDIVHQLEKLHEQQKKQSIDTNQSSHMLYRGQRISPNQLKKLQDSVGHVTITNSFISTSKDAQVARHFAGNGEERPIFESVILEISIDESEHKDLPVIFADISEKSFNPNEKEVLISMGTTFRIESIEPKENIWWIRLRTCSHENPDYLNYRMGSAFKNISGVFDENAALYYVGLVLALIGAYEKAEVIFQQIDKSKLFAFSELGNSVQGLLRISQASVSDSVSTHRTRLENYRRSLQSVIDVLQQNGCATNYFTEVKKMINSLTLETTLTPTYVDNYLRVFDMRCNEFLMMKPLLPKVSSMTPDYSSAHSTRQIINIVEENVGLSKSINFDELESKMKRTLPPNDPEISKVYWLMSKSAAYKDDYDQAIRYLNHALSVPGTHDKRLIHALIYDDLALLYKKEKRLVSCIAKLSKYYQNVTVTP